MAPIYSVLPVPPLKCPSSPIILHFLLLGNDFKNGIGEERSGSTEGRAFILHMAYLASQIVFQAQLRMSADPEANALPGVAKKDNNK